MRFIEYFSLECGLLFQKNVKLLVFFNMRRKSFDCLTCFQLVKDRHDLNLLIIYYVGAILLKPFVTNSLINSLRFELAKALYGIAFLL